MKSSAQNVLKYFEINAKRFDSLYEEESRLRYAINRVLRPGVYRRVRLTNELIASRGIESVLDIGCGSGRNAALFIGAGAHRVVGWDFSEPMIELARDYAEQKGLSSRLSFEVADALTCDATETFDLVAALGVFDYYADPIPLLRVMRARCRVAACFSIRHPTLIRMPVRRLRYALKGCPIYFYSAAEVERACLEAGFAKVQMEEGGSGSFFVVAEP